MAGMPMLQDEPSGKYESVYAILRIDAQAAKRRGGLSGKDIAVVKVVWSEERAREEIERLNGLGRGKGMAYAYQITRLEKDSDAEGGSSQDIMEPSDE